MARHSVFLLLAVIIHALALLPFWKLISDDTASPGGSEGSSISISVVPTPKQQPGLKNKPQTKQRQSSKSSFDAGKQQKVGTGSSDTEGPKAGSGSGAQGKNDILAQIRRKIERSKHYPLLARRRGITGNAIVGFEIDATGKVKQLKLVRSSQAKVLDQAALATIRRAAPFPLYPDNIELEIKFELAP